MMDDTYIWAIDLTQPKSSLITQIEIFSGRDRYTKSGLFSGPLRRLEITPFLENDSIRFLFSLDGIVQTGKNHFHLSVSAVSALFGYLNQHHTFGVYCRLEDKKLHRVETFEWSEHSTNRSSLAYDQKGRVLSCHPPKASSIPAVAETRLTITPESRLYLDSEDKQIRGFLTFVYEGVEIQANSPSEEIGLPSKVFFRNFQYERALQRQLYTVGGKQSSKNELTFKKKNFFTETLPLLQKTEITLYWGTQKKRISKAAISCSISYDMDWFSVSGSVSDNEDRYDLSELLRASRGRSYVELKDSIMFLPDAFRTLSQYTRQNGQTLVPHKELWSVHQAAANCQIDPSKYLSCLADFSERRVTYGSRWETVLRSYQKAGVAWALGLYQNGFGGCLADDMGLGKTIQAIAFLCCREKKPKYPDLIISPKVVLYNWMTELRKFAPEQEVVLAYGDFDYHSLGEKPVIYITTYDTLIHHNETFASLHYDAVIMDEAQYVKNFRTKRYQAIKSLSVQFMLALSGTPIENNIEELWALFDLFNPGMMGSHRAFMQTFVSATEKGSQIGRLKKMVSPFLLRRTKEDVLKDLPSKEECYVYCEMADAQRTLYDTLLISARKEIECKPSRYQIKDNSVVLQALLRLRETCSDPALLPPALRSTAPCGSCKFELFQEYVDQIVSSFNKVIVYSLFPRVLKRMESWCQRQGWQTFYIDGSTNDRQNIVENFEQSEQGVFLISLKAGGVGLNLTSCQYVLIYDPWWNSAAEQQAADRVYRIGQEKPVFIYHFLVKDTIEEKIYELQRKKMSLSSDVLDGLNQSAGLSMEEIVQLLL